ncbi:fimbrial chaperone [Salmonella enterica]|nr:fimbrial chaperone [Salmonella enterica]ELF1294345.1 fimbrial chaperone [Salmonella enterica]ELP9925419.1 fimbrial chaperone [Salmonella enterica]
MNKLLKKTLFSSAMIMMASQAIAAFSLNGTRFIYEEGKKNISFEVNNGAKETYGGQVWIDNTIQSKDNVYLVPSPPFFKVKPGGKQIVRLMNVNSKLPKDRESLFWLNVQELPPMPENTEGNMLAIALNTQVKVFYRPKIIMDGRKDAERNLKVVPENGKAVLKNPTPYYFAVTGAKVNGKEVTLTKRIQSSLAQLAPYSEVSLGILDLKGKVLIKSINDWGGEEWHEIN